MMNQAYKAIKIKALAFALAMSVGQFYPSVCYGEYVQIGAGAGFFRMNYLPDMGELDSQHAALTLDTRTWRRKPVGWLARGPFASWEQGTSWQHIRWQLPIYHWHLHHGVWYESQTTQLDYSVTLSDAHSYLPTSGSPLDIAADSAVGATWTLSRHHLLWYSQSRHRGVANHAGVYWQQITSPLEAELEGLTPTLFDGEGEGKGVFIGLQQDAKGSVWQWRFYLGEQVFEYSDSNTQSSTISAAQRRLLHLELELSWQHRYQLAPYWYLVPQVTLQSSIQQQLNSTAENIEQKTLMNSTLVALFSLRAYF